LARRENESGNSLPCRDTQIQKLVGNTPDRDQKPEVAPVTVPDQHRRFIAINLGRGYGQ